MIFLSITDRFPLSGNICILRSIIAADLSILIVRIPVKGRVQPKRLFPWKPSDSFIHMDVCNENFKKYFRFGSENFRHQKSKYPSTHPIVTFSSLLIGRNTIGNHRKCSYWSWDAELLFLWCGVTVSWMGILFPRCVFSSWKCSGLNIKHFFFNFQYEHQYVWRK